MTTDTPSHDLRSALEPCPFCAAEMRHVTDDQGEFYMHPGVVTDGLCLMSGQGVHPRNYAAWNRRILASDTAPRIISWGSSLSQGFSEASDTIGNGGGEAVQLKSMISLVQARGIVDAIVEHCRGADFSCDMKAATKEVMRLVNVDMRTCRHQATAGLSQLQRPDLQAWQDAQSEYFDDTIIGIVTEYAEWRDAHRPAAEPVGLREEVERLDKRETELLGQLSGLDQMNIMLVDLVRRAMRLIPEGKSLWWDQAKAALDMVDGAAALATPARTDDAAQAGGDVAAMREAAAVQYGDPPTDRRFLAKAVAHGFDPQSKEWGPTGRRWVEASWDGKVCLTWEGDGLANRHPLEILAWAELPEALPIPTQEVEPAAEGKAGLPRHVRFSGPLTNADWDRASAETERLTRELNIANADHVALWLEANMSDSPLAWLACRIVEAHEATQEAYPTGAGEGWMPINTAPKDGSHFIARGHDWGDAKNPEHFNMAVWCEEHEEWRVYDRDDQSLAYLHSWLPSSLTPADAGEGE